MRVAFALGLTALLTQPTPPNPASPSPTDIYLVPLGGGLATMKSSKPAPVSTVPGYDNQPFFSDDGSRILFAANRDGKQTDAFVFDRANGHVTQLTNTATNENSPTFIPGGGGAFSVVQSELDKTQRLWRFDAAGKNPQLILTDIKPVGYHAWIDADRVVLFVLGPPATLQIASVKTGKADIVATDVGRSLHRIPGTSLASFVHHEASGEYWVKQLDVTTRKIDPIVKAAPGSSDRDMAWMPDGATILMSSGTKILSWTRGAAPAAWTEVFDAAAFKLGAITRLAVSPKGDAVAIVVAEPAR